MVQNDVKPYTFFFWVGCTSMNTASLVQLAGNVASLSVVYVALSYIAGQQVAMVAALALLALMAIQFVVKALT